MKTLLAFLIVIAACSSAPTASKGLDPTVLFNNTGQYSPVLNAAVTFTWFDQSGQVQQTTIPWGTQACIKFTATRLADSVRFEISATSTVNGNHFQESSPWFNPATGVTADVISYPHGAEFWWFDFTKNPFAGTLAASPC